MYSGSGWRRCGRVGIREWPELAGVGGVGADATFGSAGGALFGTTGGGWGIRYFQHLFIPASDQKRVRLRLHTVALHDKRMRAGSDRDRLSQVLNADLSAVERDLHRGVGARDLDGAVVGGDVDDHAEQAGKCPGARRDEPTPVV